MISSVDELCCCPSGGALADDSPLRDLLPGGSRERDQIALVLALLKLALPADEVIRTTRSE